MPSLLLFLLIATSSISAATFKQELEGVFSTAGEDLPLLSVVRLHWDASPEPSWVNTNTLAFH